MDNTCVCYILSKDISEFFVKGCLLNLYNRKQKLYMLYCPNLKKEVQLCKCKDDDVIPVKNPDYPYLIKIARPEDRFDVFTRKLEWGKKLCKGSKAYVKLRNEMSEKYALVILRYKGNTKLGLKFGVEITDERYKGRGDDKVLYNLFTCPKKCGMLVDLDKLELEDPSLPQTVEIQNDPPVAAGKTENKLQGRIHSNDMAKLAATELESQDIRGGLSATEEKFAQMEGEKVKADREEMELQAKLMDAMEKVAQTQREKSAVEQSTAAVLSDAELEADAENVRFDGLFCQLRNGYINGCYQDPHRVLQQKNRVLSSQWEVDRNVIEIISHDPIGSGGWGTIHMGEVERCSCVAQKGRQGIFEVHHLQFLVSGMELLDTNLHCTYEQNHVEESKL